MTTTPTQAARVRSQVDHPIIDADGHFVELGPLLQDEVISYVEDTGGAALRERFLATAKSFDTSSSLADRGDAEVRRQWKAMPSWWGWQTAGVRDRATSHLPALLYERLDEIGIDFTILYPSMALGYFEIADEELSSVACRAVNRYHQRLFEPYRDRCTVGALIPMNTPAQAVAEVRYAVEELGAKSVLLAGLRASPDRGGRVPPRHVRTRQRPRLRPAVVDVRGARRRAGGAQRTATAPRHAVDLELRVQPRERAGRGARVAVQVAVPLGGDEPVPRVAVRVPRGRRGVGVRAVLVARRALGEAQPRRHRRARSRPSRRRRAAHLLRRVRRRRGDGADGRAARLLRPARRRVPRRSTSSRPSASRPPTTCARASNPTSTSAARPTTRWWRGRSATT